MFPFFLSDRKIVASSLVALFAAGATSAALAENENGPIQVLLKHRQQAEWSDKFDSSFRDQVAVKSSHPTLSPETAAYIETAIAQYSSIVANGGWPSVPSGPNLRLGVRDRNVVQLRQRLIATGDLQRTAGTSPVFDSYVDLAVRRYQVRNGLTPDGIVGKNVRAMLNVSAQQRLAQLQTNLVRVRSMSGYLGDRYVMVNIPAAEIEAVENGVVRSRHTAVVGKIDRQTPIVNSKVHELNFNPYWHVPVSIIRKDLIPKMKEDPEYLSRNKIRIYRTKDEEIAATQVDWNTDEAVNYMFRQDPGEINSLGSVRINFHNKHSVYLHDTPSKSLFGRDYRFHSSGCVRVQNVRELVAWLGKGNDGWSRARVDEVIRTGERLDVKLNQQVPIYMNYVTAWANKDGIVNFRDDIYKRDLPGAETETDDGNVALRN